MKKYEYDLDTMETIFQEITIDLQKFEGSHEVFVGPRDSNKAFEAYFTGQLVDVYENMTEGERPGYVELLGALAAGIEWLIWIRQNDQVKPIF